LIVSKPHGDSAPYDFIVEGSDILRRVQVRSIGSRSFYGSYQVSVAYGGRDRSAFMPGQVEVVAVYIIPEDTWYLIPVDALQGRRSVHLGGGRRLLECFRERWTILGAPQRNL